MGDSQLSTEFVVVVLVLTIVWLRFFLWPKKTKHEKEREAAKEEAREREREMRGEPRQLTKREAKQQAEWDRQDEADRRDGILIEVPPLEPGEPWTDMLDKKINWVPPGSTRGQPMGPGAPTGLPPTPQPPVPSAPASLPPTAPPDPPLDGKFGPEFLAGALKQESEEAFALLHRYTNDDYRRALVERTGNPDWAMYYAMAADWLGAMRWYRKVINTTFDDSALLDLFWSGRDWTAETMERYRNHVPPGPDLDQALRILGFYRQYMRTNLVREVSNIMVRVLIEIDAIEQRKFLAKRK